MAEVKTYTLTLDAQELHDLIEAVLVASARQRRSLTDSSERDWIWTRRSS